MKQHILLLVTIGLSLTMNAQNITFETNDYKQIGIYDTWEASPFRTGALQGNYAVVDNHLTEVDEMLGKAPNPSQKILAIQRSRFGSNTFGARIDLTETFELTPETQYIHVMVNRPYSGRIMVVGLGKRTDRPAQSPDTEQFWAMSTSDVLPNQWVDVVLPIKGNGSIDIYSLVVVPDCESPHNYTNDALCYIDNIEINDDSTSRSANIDTLSPSATTSTSFCIVSNTNRNGEVTLPDGSQLMGYKHPIRKSLKIRVRPENGFEHDGIIIHYGSTSQRREAHLSARKVKNSGLLRIPAKYMVGNVDIEGVFIEAKR